MRIGIDIGGSHIAVAVIDKNKILKKLNMCMKVNSKNRFVEILKNI